MVSLYAFDPFNGFHFLLSLSLGSWFCGSPLLSSYSDGDHLPEKAQTPLSIRLVKRDWDE